MKLDTSFISVGMEAAGVPLEERGAHLSVGLARAIAYRLPLPTEPVSAPRIWYAENCEREVLDTAAFVNEQVVLDLGDVTELCYKLWTMRYNVCYNGSEEATANVLDSACADSVVVSRPVAAIVASAESRPLMAGIARMVAKAMNKE